MAKREQLKDDYLENRLIRRRLEARQVARPLGCPADQSTVRSPSLEGQLQIGVHGGALSRRGARQSPGRRGHDARRARGLKTGGWCRAIGFAAGATGQREGQQELPAEA